jgi:hypothetical protein
MPSNPSNNRPDGWHGHRHGHINSFCCLLEMLVDSFINVIQSTDNDWLWICLVHCCYTQSTQSSHQQQSATGHNGEESISIKKLVAGDGVWVVWKEILWDGCVTMHSTASSSKKQRCWYIYRRSTVCYNTHNHVLVLGLGICLPPVAATLARGMLNKPWQWNSFGSTYSQIHSCSNTFVFSRLSPSKIMCKCPMLCKELTPDTPGYVGFCNASKLGAGSKSVEVTPVRVHGGGYRRTSQATLNLPSRSLYSCTTNCILSFCCNRKLVPYEIQLWKQQWYLHSNLVGVKLWE